MPSTHKAMVGFPGTVVNWVWGSKPGTIAMGKVKGSDPRAPSGAQFMGSLRQETLMKKESHGVEGLGERGASWDPRDGVEASGISI